MAYEFHYTPTGTGVISGKEVLEQTEDAINDLGDQISGDVQTAIDTANNALNTANTASADAQNAVNTASTAYTAATNAQNTANMAQNTASNALTAAQNAQNDVNALGNRVTTAENNISQNTSDISGLTTRMGTAEGNITNLQTAVSTAQATANSAQQTATTARQQSYVFRYSSTALTASSTNANSLLDNTDNLKVGDKVIDSSGVLFSITAIDTQNSTFTIGTALVDLAQDSDVVHKSGDETVGGIKNFTDDTYIKSLNFTNEVPSPSSSSSSTMPLVTTVTYTDQTESKVARINLRITASGDKSLYPHENNQYALGLQSRKWSEVRAIQYYYGSSDTEFSDKFVTTDTAQTISGVKTFSDTPIFTTFDGIRFRCAHNSNAYVTFRNLNQVNPGSIILSAHDGNVGTTIHLVNKTLIPYNTNDIDLGTASRKWRTFNGLEPSSLSLPSGGASNFIDISSYITDLSGNVNNYTAPANGWISIAVVGTAIAIVSSSWSDSRLRASSGNVRMLYPVLKNETLDISVIGTTLDYARFIPCQGNI